MTRRMTTTSDPDWCSDPQADDDESSAFGFNEPTSVEPPDEDE